MSHSAPLLLVSLVLPLWPTALGQCLCSLEMPFSGLGLYCSLARVLSGLCGVSIFSSVFVTSSPLGLCIIHCLIPSLILPLSSKDMASLPVTVPDVISSSPKTVDPHATSFFFTLNLFSALSPIAGTASSASSGRQVSIFNPLLLYSTQRICMGRQCVPNCSLSLQLHALWFPPSGLPGRFTLWSPNPRSWPSHLLLHGLHRNSCPQPVSEPLTTKPVLHLLSLSDFDTLSHATLWGEGVLSQFMQTCVTYIWPEHHPNVSAPTVALSASQMSHIFKAWYLQAVTSHHLSKSCLLTLMMTACKTFLLDFQINQLSSNACHVFHAAPIPFWDLLHMELLSCVQEHRGKKESHKLFFTFKSVCRKLSL